MEDYITRSTTKRSWDVFGWSADKA